MCHTSNFSIADAPVADQWEEDAALPQESVLRQIKMIASTASIHRLADALLVKPQPYLKADHTAYVWAFCTLLKCCLVRTHLSTEAQVALAISPKVVKLIWHDYLKVISKLPTLKEDHCAHGPFTITCHYILLWVFQYCFRNEFR